MTALDFEALPLFMCGFLCALIVTAQRLYGPNAIVTWLSSAIAHPFDCKWMCRLTWKQPGEPVFAAAVKPSKLIQ